MPIHLGPQQTVEARASSRRQFLARTAGAAAGLLLGQACRGSRGIAAGVPRPWALFSDTHIHAALFEKNQDFHMAANFVKAVSDAIAERPGAALVNGDLARLVGNPGDYESFLKIVEPLRLAGIPLHATLGNHDDRSNFRKGLAIRDDRAGAVTEKHVGAVDADGIRWILLDSLEKVNSTPGHLGKEQLEWMVRRLDEAPAAPTLLFLHHNPETVDIGLKDTEDLLRVIRPRRQVKAVFFGHTHAWRRWEDDGIHMVNLPATAYAFKAGEPIGWVLATPAPEGLELELRCLGLAHAENRKKIALRWRE